MTALNARALVEAEMRRALVALAAQDGISLNDIDELAPLITAKVLAAYSRGAVLSVLASEVRRSSGLE